MGEYRKARAHYVIMWSQTPLQGAFSGAEFLRILRPMYSLGQKKKEKKRNDAVLCLRSSLLKRDRCRRVV